MMPAELNFNPLCRKKKSSIFFEKEKKKKWNAISTGKISRDDKIELTCKTSGRALDKKKKTRINYELFENRKSFPLIFYFSEDRKNIGCVEEIFLSRAAMLV